MAEYQDYKEKEKEDEYALDGNGKYIGDVKDYHLMILIYIFVGVALIIPLSIIEAIWFNYLPTCKIIWTCLVLDIVLFLYLRVMCFEYDMGLDGKLVWKKQHRKLK